MKGFHRANELFSAEKNPSFPPESEFKHGVINVVWLRAAARLCALSLRHDDMRSSRYTVLCVCLCVLCVLCVLWSSLSYMEVKI